MTIAIVLLVALVSCEADLSGSQKGEDIFNWCSAVLLGNFLGTIVDPWVEKKLRSLF
jgi:hypothetical protein